MFFEEIYMRSIAVSVTLEVIMANFGLIVDPGFFAYELDKKRCMSLVIIIPYRANTNIRIYSGGAVSSRR